jgi:Co/Zn/Cd efflux system component
MVDTLEMVAIIIAVVIIFTSSSTIVDTKQSCGIAGSCLGPL